MADWFRLSAEDHLAVGLNLGQGENLHFSVVSGGSAQQLVPRMKS